MPLSSTKTDSVTLVSFEAFRDAAAGFSVRKLSELYGTSAEANPIAFPVNINGDRARAYIVRAHLDDQCNKDVFEATAVIDPADSTVHHLEIRITGAGIRLRVVREESIT